jgi:hypothetical protein
MKVVLIEFGGSHAECLYSQILFLKAENIYVSLICSKDLESQVSQFTEADEKLFFDFNGGKLESYKNIFIIWKYIIKNQFSKVIFNSAHGGLIKALLLLPFPSGIEFIGTIHYLHKLKNSIGQKIIGRKVKKQFVLSDYLLEKLKTKTIKGFHSFYPIFFPAFEKVELMKPEGEIWICIPGGVQFTRRDYMSLLEGLEKEELNKNIKFIILGKCAKEGDGLKVRNKIKSLGLKNNFVLWDQFVENNTFLTYMINSDYIMPLIHRESSNFNLYEDQISGNFNLAFAYKIPFLCDDCLKEMDDLKDNSIFYKVKTMISTLNNLKNTAPNFRSNIYKNEKWTFSYQKNSYIKFICN